jgi:hypothetical protein
MASRAFDRSSQMGCPHLGTGRAAGVSGFFFRVFFGAVSTSRAMHWPLAPRTSPLLQGTGIFTHRGGLPTVPRGHFGFSMALHFGGVPIVPGGHFGLSTDLQFGHVPIWPDGHFGLSIGLHLGGRPVVPGGHFGVSTGLQFGHVPV